MRRTLLLIPHEMGSLSIFGFGWVLGLLVLAAIVTTGLVMLSKQSVADYWRQQGTLWLVAAVVIAFVLPAIELENTSGQPVGLAIRGYGVMLLLGVAAAVGLAIVRARRYGLGEDVILGLAPWVFVGGIVGARLFYVIEYHEQFFTDDLSTTFRNLINFTQGGLVVYGSFIGGFFAFLLYAYRHHLPMLRLGDAIIPTLFIGLALGRIGCLMNGCCYGGKCEDGWAAIRFPNGSPVFEDQLASGELAGLELDSLGQTVEKVHADSPAAARGITPGATVGNLTVVRSQESIDDATPAEDAPFGLVAVVDGKDQYWSAADLPPRALPVLATQIFSSLGGLALCLALCVFSRGSYRDGVVMCTGFAGYAVMRFVMEILRSDEPGQFGTALTISQWVSILVFAIAIASLMWILSAGKASTATT